VTCISGDIRSDSVSRRDELRSGENNRDEDRSTGPQKARDYAILRRCRRAIGFGFAPHDLIWDDTQSGF
jgi:hypothetical protein